MNALLKSGIFLLVALSLSLAGCNGGGTTPPPPTTYTIGGTVSGLAGTGLVLLDNGGNNLTVTGNGSFTFTTALASGANYSVTVMTQPTGPNQTCGVTSGSGTVASSNVTSVTVTCTTNSFTIGGTVSGLAGTGLVLQDNGGNNLPVSANGSFTFTTAIASGAGYTVTVLTQPSGPVQTCMVTSGGGTVTNANVTSVQVACTTNTYTIGGTVQGLAGTGLVLQDNGGNNLPVSANGGFTFTTAIASGAGYTVTVLTQPSNLTQTCKVTNGSGTVTNANITSVQVGCTTNTYTIGGMVSGLAGTGLVLQDNGGNNLPVSANGGFTFTTAIASGAGYNVTVLTQPSGPVQTCMVTSGGGTVTNANISSVQIACMTNAYSIGGMVSGLAGTGLVLQDNGGKNLPVSANGGFTFTTAIASGAGYSVTVLTQPSNLWQTCMVTSGSGTVTNANITGVQVACTTNIYTIGGMVSGLAGTGLVLQDNGGNNLPVAANGGFTFTTAIASGGSYNVTVFSQPSSPEQNCLVTSGGGTATNANITGVQVACTTIPTFTIGGTVSAYVGTGLVLQDNGGDSLPVNADGSFTFPTGLLSGTNYTVTVSVEPSSPVQSCGVTNGTGTATANVTNVVVDCGFQQWTWVSGTNNDSQAGIYGTLGTAAPGNVPGGRAGSATWTDASGNFWLFGGSGPDSVSIIGDLNDLWEYSVSQNEWTWMGGSQFVNQSGTYGTKGTAAPGNIPGARVGAMTWIDKNGNFWLFGGQGPAGRLYDLWEYSVSENEWTWMGGSDVPDQPGTYGTLGTAAPGNIPGARIFSMSWTDKNGNFWLFGGSGPSGEFNDLWEYSVSLNEWTWMGGSSTLQQAGTYGTKGTPAPGNIPGGRDSGTTWTDASGNFWLFGGSGYDSAGNPGRINDLWEYSVSLGQWTWIGGSNVINQAGTYGTQGTAAPGNIPGARSGATAWVDSSTGNIWLFGGAGYDSTGAFAAWLNDLWLYSAGQWTWMGGSNLYGQVGTYGTQGIPAPGNIPGARDYSGSWIDKNGNLWLFGGAHNTAVQNDLWRFEP